MFALFLTVFAKPNEDLVLVGGKGIYASGV